VLVLFAQTKTTNFLVSKYLPFNLLDTCALFLQASPLLGSIRVIGFLALVTYLGLMRKLGNMSIILNSSPPEANKKTFLL
jgi:hypothetical protein